MEKIQELIKREKIEFIDLKYVGLLGDLRHITIPVQRFNYIIKDGVGIDGSSIPGFKGVKRCDMIVRPDLDYHFIDPFFCERTLSFFGNCLYSYDQSPFEKDPRNLVVKLTDLLKKKGLTAYFLPELEFYLFNAIEFDEGPGYSFYRIVSEEAIPDERFPDQGYRLRKKGGYHTVPPFDRTYNFRDKLTQLLQACGIEVKYHHHEVGPASQVEIELAFNDIKKICDFIILAKYLIRNCAHRAGLSATFMPKPLYGEPGNGLHIHHYLKKDDKPILFSLTERSKLSRIGEHYISGLLEHAPSLCALTNPTTNSYKRLIAGYEAPTYTDYAIGSRAAAIRIPEYVRNLNEQRIEYRIPDCMANPYLALSAIILAGLDGIEKKIVHPGKKSLPTNLLDALTEFKHDHKFLLTNNVFTEEIIDQWIEIKKSEFETVNQHPTVQEFILYYGV